MRIAVDYDNRGLPRRGPPAAGLTTAQPGGEA
jgi:hypothetical protein